MSSGRIKYITFFLTAILFCSFAWPGQSGSSYIYSCVKGSVRFVSKAPLETISAESQKLSGAIDLNKKSFIFSVPVRSFEGFNSPLQREHFNENYLETDKIPSAHFNGKIIEDINLLESGTYQVRAKGMMKIHNIEKEMLIKAKIVSNGQSLQVDALFPVLLSDYDIRIPKVVSQKIAQEVQVEVKLVLNPK